MDGSTPSSFTLPIATSGTYYLVVDGAQGSCGPFTLSGYLRGSVVGVGDRLPDRSRSEARLIASPNPGRARIQLSAYLPGIETGTADLALYDLAGKKILDHRLTVESGRCEFTWDGRDGQGSEVSAGIYDARIESEGVRGSCRVAVTR